MPSRRSKCPSCVLNVSYLRFTMASNTLTYFGKMCISNPAKWFCIRFGPSKVTIIFASIKKLTLLYHYCTNIICTLLYRVKSDNINQSYYIYLMFAVLMCKHGLERLVHVCVGMVWALCALRSDHMYPTVLKVVFLSVVRQSSWFAQHQYPANTSSCMRWHELKQIKLCLESEYNEPLCL